MTSDDCVTTNLGYHYDTIPVLQNINLTIQTGSIVGILGNNGAGKTTLLKCLLGLLSTKKQQGSIKWWNDSNMCTAKQHIGSLIETPYFHEHLNGFDNLQWFQQLIGLSDPEHIRELLTQFHLPLDKSVSSYSLGMRQRLAIARVFVHKPKCLILDEPTNALDPQGIIDVRNILLQQNKEKKTTIIISSHDLHELESLCTDIIILDKGKMVIQGTIEDIKQKMHSTPTCHLISENLDQLDTALQELHYQTNRTSMDITISIDKKESAELNHQLHLRGIHLSELRFASHSLEDVYVHITKSSTVS